MGVYVKTVLVRPKLVEAYLTSGSIHVRLRRTNTDRHLLRVEQCATLRTQIRPFEVARPERSNILSAWVVQGRPWFNVCCINHDTSGTRMSR